MRSYYTAYSQLLRKHKKDSVQTIVRMRGLVGHSDVNHSLVQNVTPRAPEPSEQNLSNSQANDDGDYVGRLEGPEARHRSECMISVTTQEFKLT